MTYRELVEKVTPLLTEDSFAVHVNFWRHPAGMVPGQGAFESVEWSIYCAKRHIHYQAPTADEAFDKLTDALKKENAIPSPMPSILDSVNV